MNGMQDAVNGRPTGFTLPRYPLLTNSPYCRQYFVDSMLGTVDANHLRGTPSTERSVPEVKVAVLGTGAIGAYVGAALNRAGAEVHLVARGPHLAAMRRNGVRVLSPRGDFTAHPHTTGDPAEIGPVDFVFLGLKANAYAACGPLIEPLLHDTTAVVAAQNGIPWWYFHRHGGPYTATAWRASTRVAARSVRCSRPNGPSAAWSTPPPNSKLRAP